MTALTDMRCERCISVDAAGEDVSCAISKMLKVGIDVCVVDVIMIVETS